MAKSYEIKRYKAWDFDDYFCLKPPVLLIVAISYLCRSFLVFAIAMLGSIKGNTENMSLLLQAGGHPGHLAITGVPALFVLIALFRRSPNGGRFARWIWKRGRIFLATSAVLEISAGLFLASQQGGETSLLTMTFLLLDLYILLYVLISKRVKDSFSDFPPTAAALEL